MTKTFTENDLVRFIYGETSESENIAIKDALLCNPGLQEIFNELSDIKKALESQMLEPGKKVVDNILNYSKKFSDIHVLK